MKLYSSGHKKFTTIVSTAQRNSVKNKTPSIASFLLLLHSSLLVLREGDIRSVYSKEFKQSKHPPVPSPSPTNLFVSGTLPADLWLSSGNTADCWHWIKAQGSAACFTREVWWQCTRAQVTVVKPLYLWPTTHRLLITRTHTQSDRSSPSPFCVVVNKHR